MTSDSAPEDPATEDGQGAPRPNFLAAAVLRVVEGLMGTLQGVRARLGAPGTELPPVEKRPPTAVRMIFVSCVALLIGALLGMWFSHDLYAERLDSQAEAIVTQQSDLIGLQKENERAQRAETQYRDTLAETQKALVETQRSLVRATAAARNKGVDTGTPVASGASGVSSPPRGASRSGARGETRQAEAPRPQSGTCDISSSNPQESLTRCLSDYNR